jgi:hypothetical protein
MSLGVVCVMKSDVVSVKHTANPVMTEAVMEQSLATRYDEVRAESSQYEQR